jgi:signal transduction histidine kinase
MRERIADIGGELSVATPPADAERGTEICARCPESLQIPKA